MHRVKKLIQDVNPVHVYTIFFFSLFIALLGWNFYQEDKEFKGELASMLGESEFVVQSGECIEGSYSTEDCGGLCEGGICEPGITRGSECVNCPVEESDPTCFDNIENGNETGVDCGGDCNPCDTQSGGCMSPGGVDCCSLPLEACESQSGCILNGNACEAGTSTYYDCPEISQNIGNSCNDSDSCTINDKIQSDCSCNGTFQDSDGDGICDAQDSSTCIDYQTCNPNSSGQCGNGYCLDVGWGGECICDEVFDCPSLEKNKGDPCDDGNPNTVNDFVTNACVCTGTYVPPSCENEELFYDGVQYEGYSTARQACIACNGSDCENEGDSDEGIWQCCNSHQCLELYKDFGEDCDDGDATTENDEVGADCVCRGETISTNFSCGSNNCGPSLPDNADWDEFIVSSCSECEIVCDSGYNLEEVANGVYDCVEPQIISCTASNSTMPVTFLGPVGGDDQTSLPEEIAFPVDITCDFTPSVVGAQVLVYETVNQTSQLYDTYPYFTDPLSISLPAGNFQAYCNYDGINVCNTSIDLEYTATPKYSCNGTSCELDANGSYTTSNCNNACVQETPKYSCDGGTCILDPNGGYTTSNCNNACVQETPKYSCDGGTCILDPNGGYTTSNCNNACQEVIQKYSCNGSSCEPDVNGNYTTSNCNNACQEVALKYSCDGVSCIPDPNGDYTTSNCNNACQEVIQKYSCNGSSCEPDPNGGYTTSNCNNACQEVIQKYSCNGSSCELDPNGDYTTSNCDNACGGSSTNTTYSREPSNRGECSVECGGGVENRSLICLQSTTYSNGGSFTPVDDAICESMTCQLDQNGQPIIINDCLVKPDIQQACNTQACPTDDGGETEGGEDNSGTTDGTVPSYSRLLGNRGICSVTCGGGTRSAPVSCIDQNGTVVSDDMCSGVRPVSSESCNMQPCAPEGCYTHDVSIRIQGITCSEKDPEIITQLQNICTAKGYDYTNHNVELFCSGVSTRTLSVVDTGGEYTNKCSAYCQGDVCCTEVCARYAGEIGGNMLAATTCQAMCGTNTACQNDCRMCEEYMGGGDSDYVGVSGTVTCCEQTSVTCSNACTGKGSLPTFASWINASQNSCNECRWVCDSGYVESEGSCISLPIYSRGEGDFGECSKECGGGTQKALVSCFNEDKEVVADSFCDGVKPEPTTRSCNSQACTQCASGDSRSCGSLNMGICTSGSERCIDGIWSGVCEGLVGPVAEICDSLDNDCDGSIDEGNVCAECEDGAEKICGSSLGECKKGIQRCISGSWSACSDSVGPVDEFCDGRDNNCNGAIDEGDVCSSGGGGGGSTGGSGGSRGGNNYCGDGNLSFNRGEECDDGNYIDGDGCSSNCRLEGSVVVPVPTDPTPAETIETTLKNALKRLRMSCRYDDAEYHDIRFRDVQWSDMGDPADILRTYCIVKGYDKTNRDRFHNDAATGVGEYIKVLTKIFAMEHDIHFDEYSVYNGDISYFDVSERKWYAPYIGYAERQGLLENVGKSMGLVKILKPAAPISKDDAVRMLDNAGIDEDYRFMMGFGRYLKRKDMAEVMVTAFGETFADYRYVFGNNIDTYAGLLQKLKGKTDAEQREYIKGFILELDKLDKEMMGEKYLMHVDGAIEFLGRVLRGDFELEKDKEVKSSTQLDNEYDFLRDLFDLE